MKNVILLLAISASLVGCGRNPHVELKSKSPKLSATLTPGLEPESTAPSLIIRDKSTKSEGIMDFGSGRTGEKLTKDFEVVNVGTAKAQEITIPDTVGSFKVTNVNCGKELDVNESCDLTGEIVSLKDDVEKNEVTVKYKDAAGKDLLAKTFLLASLRDALVPPKGPEAKVVLILKNGDSSNIVLSDIPVGNTVILNFELRNVGDAGATNVVLPKLPDNFIVRSTTCTDKLDVNAACDIVVEYAPTKVESSNIVLNITYQGGVINQVIVFNSIHLDSSSRIEVVGGIVGKEIFELMNVKPEMLSPFQDVLGIDLGTLTLNKPLTFKVNLKNNGESVANVTEVKGFQTDEFAFNQKDYPGLNGTCSQSISKGDCFLDVKVSPKQLGNIHDIVEITYKDNRGQTLRLSLILIAHVEQETIVQCKTLAARSNADQSSVVSDLTAKGLYKLPYKLKSTKSSASVMTLFNTQSNHNLRMTKNRESLVVPSNHNVMVQFGFDITKEDLENIKSIKLELDILKLSTEGVKFDSTEVLCLNENRQCSGTFFSDSNFSNLNTNNYTRQSDYFSQELLRSSQQDLSALKNILAGRGLTAQGAALPADHIFRLKKSFPLSSLFGSIQNIDLSKGLNFVLADDSVLLSAPRLILESSQAACSK